MIANMVAIVQDNWLLLLIGQYPYGPLGGLAMTLILSVCSITLAFPFSIFLSLARLSPRLWLYYPSTCLVYGVRGVPLLMFILWGYFIVPVLLGGEIPSFVTVLFTLVVYQGVFMSEVVRAGILSLGKGQMEAAKALGHSYAGALIFIILPQALFNMIPSILSTFISTVKDTTLGYVVNVPDLTFAAGQINTRLMTQPFEVFTILALSYFVICWSLTKGAALIEKRIEQKRAGMGNPPNHLPAKQIIEAL